jgi:fumarylacetoacetase
MSAIALNESHDSAAKSWIASANDPGTDFPIQNLPYGSFARGGSGQSRIGVAIGDQIFDLHAAAEQRALSIAPDVRDACLTPCLNTLMALGLTHWSALRKAIFELLKSGDGEDQRKRAALPSLLPIKDAAMQLPYDIGDFSDFYASIYHATNAGSMLRPQNPLLPNYKFVPVAYHGRSSSFVVSGTPITRPCGQRRLDQDTPEFGASRHLDYEAEVAFVVGTGNALGRPIPIDEAASHLFGLGLLNDWSARDIQAWEYQPLGPFLAKSFASTLSPWVVTMEALAPFRVKPAARRSRGSCRHVCALDRQPGHSRSQDRRASRL